MWYELFVIMSAATGFFALLTFLLLSRVPNTDDLVAIGTAIVDAKIKEFGLNSPSGGGRPAEGWAGMLERFLATPVGQDLAKRFIGDMTRGGSYIGP